MKNFITYLVLNLSIMLVAINGKAQSYFEEGVIIYKADSIFNKIDSKFDFVSREIKLYKKNDIYRLESVKKSLNNDFEPEVIIQIINNSGKYIFKDSISYIGNSAFFISTEEEKLLLSQRALYGKISTYKVQKVGLTTMLNIPVEKINFINISNNTVVKILLAGSIMTNFGSFFEEYRSLKGTPLLFSDNEGGLLIRYRAISITTTKLPNNLFYINPNVTILTLDRLKR